MIRTQRAATAAMIASMAMVASDYADGRLFGGFAPQQSYSVGKLPSSIAIGDVNGNGALDLVTADSDSGDVSLLLGNGDGTFQTATMIPLTDYAYYVLLDDLNGNDHLDLVVLGYSMDLDSEIILVLLNNGDGTFQSPLEFAFSGSAIAPVIADVNGDNVPDLMMLNFGSVSIFLGVGDGTFQAPLQFVTASSPTGIAIDDLDGDDVPDIAVTSFQSNTVSVHLGNGDGTFQPRQEYGVGVRPTGVAIGDLNGDGVPDLATSNQQSQSVSILLGVGDSTFQAQQEFPLGVPAGFIAITDMDGDGALDLAVTDRFLSGNSVTVLLGVGDGTFEAPQSYAVDDLSEMLVIGDLNGDAAPDVVTVNSGGNSVSVLINQTIVTAPSSFSLLSPPDASSNLPLPEVVVAWPGVEAAPVKWGASGAPFGVTYTLIVATDPGLMNVVIQESGLVASQLGLPTGVLMPGRMYYWSVVAENALGVQTPSTPAVFSFSTKNTADLNGDGFVGSEELSIILGSWGPVTP